MKPMMLIIMTAVLMYGCTSREEAAEEFFQNGLVFYNQEDMAKARVEFLNAMQKNPQRADVYYYLGLIAKGEGDFPLVLENMNFAMVLDPTNLDAKTHVAELYVFNKDFARAEALADEILRRDSNYHDAFRIKAAVRMGNKQYTQAKELLAKALVAQPNDATLYGLSAAAEESLGNLTAAVNHLNHAIDLSEDKVQYLLFRSNLHRQLKNNIALEQDLRALIDEKPSEERFIRSLTDLLLEQGKHKQAMLMLRKFLKDNPDNTAAALYYVTVLETHNPQKAEATLLRMMEEKPNVATFHFHHIDRLLTSGAKELAKKKLMQLTQDDRIDAQQRLNARAMLAKLVLAEGEQEQANTLIDNNLTINPQHEKSLLLRAQQQLEQKHYEKAVDTLRTVLRNNPSSESGLVMLGNVYSQSGSGLLADDAYRQALIINPANLSAAIPVVNTLIENQDLERSDNIITAALARQPDDQALQIFLAQVKILKKDWQGLASLAATLEQSDNFAYAQLFKGRLRQGLGEFEQAVDLYKQALEADPKLVPALQGLSSSYVALSQEVTLLNYLADYRRRHPDDIIAYSVTAAIHQRMGETDASINYLQQALTIKPDWVNGYATLAGQKNALGDSQGAIETYQRGIANNPQDLSLSLLLASYYESLGTFDQSAAMYRDIIAKQPDNLLAINNYASLLLDKVASPASISEALRYAEQLKSSAEPYFMDTVGWALVKNKRFSEGERYLRLAADNASTVPGIHYHLGVALKHLGRTEEAKQWLSRAANSAPLDSELHDDIQQELKTL